MKWEAENLYRALKGMSIVSEMPVIEGRFAIEDHFLIDSLAGKLSLPSNYRVMGIFLSSAGTSAHVISMPNEEKKFIVPLMPVLISGKIPGEQFSLYETNDKEITVTLSKGDTWIFLACPSTSFSVRAVK